MKRNAWWFSALAGAALLSGCVERRFVVQSEPPGAVVLVNGRPIGATPSDDHFVHYGTYHFTLIRDGYETLEIDQPIKAPWYEWFPLDFVSENLVPWRISDVRRFDYVMQPVQQMPPDEMIRRAEELRQRGQAIGPPPGGPALPPPPVLGPPPPAEGPPGAPPGPP
jgi:hypothetical protein